MYLCHIQLYYCNMHPDRIPQHHLNQIASLWGNLSLAQWWTKQIHFAQTLSNSVIDKVTISMILLIEL